jgi:hypothetical protein
MASPIVEGVAALHEGPDMDTVAEIIKYLLIFIGAMAVLFVLLLLVISRLPAGNPLRITLAALARRVAATWGLALIDIPATAMQPLGDVWDIGTLVFLAYYWYTFFRDDAGRAFRTLRDVARSTPRPR